MGSSSGGQSQTQTTELPPELQFWSSRYLNALGNLIMPGGNFANLSQSPLPYQAVAPLTNQQIQGMNLTSAETYGPQGAPQGQGVDTNALMQSIAASPYWQGQMSRNPYTAQAFSQPALQQLGLAYA